MYVSKVNNYNITNYIESEIYVEKPIPTTTTLKSKLIEDNIILYKNIRMFVTFIVY